MIVIPRRSCRMQEPVPRPRCVGQCHTWMSNVSSCQGTVNVILGCQMSAPVLGQCHTWMSNISSCQGTVNVILGCQMSAPVLGQ